MTLGHRKVIFLDSVHSALINGLTKAGFDCSEDYEISSASFARQIHEYYGIVIRSRFKLDAQLLEQASQLRFIARSGAGMENIDLEYAAENNIDCYNSPEGNRDAVGEHALGMLLSLFNRINTADLEVRQGLWRREENRGIELAGKTVGIIGYGQMGSAFASKLQGFNCQVIAYDKYKSGFGHDHIREASLEELFQQSDVISLHVPLTPETTFMVDDEFLDRFEKDIFLINTARGKNVRIAAVVRALQSGKLKGACLDVLEYEKTSFEQLQPESMPEDFKYLKKDPRVLLSPHVAGWTIESYEKLSTVLLDKILSDHT